MTAVVLVVIGFGLGSIPFGVVVARRMGIDIKAHGSGNIGATNVTRILGPGPGAIVLALDALKGALPVALADYFSGHPWTIVVVGFSAIVGHCFSPLLGGHGGKGVATTLGVYLVLVPELVALAVLVFVAVLAITRIPALGSLAGVGMLVGMLIARGDTPVTVLGCVTLVLLVYTHRRNLAALTSARR